MNLAITSGGTRVAIDDVRILTNVSRGGTGAKIAEYALERWHSVRYVGNDSTSLPFLWNPLADAWDDKSKPGSEERFLRFANAVSNGSLVLRKAQSFAKYAEEVLSAARSESTDAVVLSAAVSDYGPKSAVEGKLDSRNGFSLELEPLPKIRDLIRETNRKVAIVAFKQMPKGCGTGELLQRAHDSMVKWDHDLVVANVTDSVNGSFRALETWIFGSDGRLVRVEDRHDLPRLLVEEWIPDAVERRKSA